MFVKQGKIPNCTKVYVSIDVIVSSHSTLRTKIQTAAFLSAALFWYGTG